MQDPISPDERQPLLHSPEGSRRGDSGAYPQNGHQEQGKHTGKVDEASRLAALQALPWYRRPSVYWILPFIVLVGLEMGVSTAPVTYLIIKIICRRYHQSNNLLLSDDMCDTPEIQALSATVMSRTAALEAAIGVFTMGYYTSLSDRYGRKFLMHLTLIPGLLLQALIYYMSRPTNTLGLWVIYVSAVFKGLTGAGGLLDPALSAYLSDCVPSGEMSKNLGFVVVFFSTGLITGPMLAKFLMKSTGRTSAPVLVSIAFVILLILYVIVMPESLSESTKQDAEREAAERKTEGGESALAKAKHFFKNIFDPVLFLLPGRTEISDDVKAPPSRYTLLMVLIGNGVLQIATDVVKNVFIPYMNLVFGWTAVESSNYYIVKGAASFVTYIAIFPGLQKLYKKTVGQKKGIQSQTVHDEAHQSTEDVAPAVSSEKGAAILMDLNFMIFGGIITLVGFIIVPPFESEAIIFISTCILEMGGVAGPAFLAFMTSYVPPHQTGKLLGGIIVLSAMFSSAGSLFGAWVFSKTSATVPSTVFSVSAAISFLGFLILLGVLASYRRRGARTL